MRQITGLVLGLLLGCGGMAAKADPIGLVGKTFTPSHVPPGTDVTKSEFGNGYFYCGGAMIEGKSVSYTVLRKGLKASCDRGAKVLALTSGEFDQPRKVHDVIVYTSRKGEQMSYDCTGASVVISKLKNAEYLANHVAAWKLVDNKFVPVGDMKKIRCQNMDWGV